MNLILDTSLLIAAERQQFNIQEFLLHEASEIPIALPTIVVSEYWHGLERSAPGKKKEIRELFFNQLLETVEVISFDLQIARVHARLSADLARGGVAIGAHDLIIAATALAFDSRLATLNVRDFSRIPDLRFALIAPYLLKSEERKLD